MTKTMGLPCRAVQCSAATSVRSMTPARSLTFFFLAVGLLDAHLGSILQADATGDHDAIAGAGAAEDLHLVRRPYANLHFALVHGGIRAHHHQSGTAVVGRQKRIRRDDDCVRNRVRVDLYVNGSSGAKTAARI